MTLANKELPGWLLGALAAALLGSVGWGTRVLMAHDSRITAVEVQRADDHETLKGVAQDIRTIKDVLIERSNATPSERSGSHSR